MSRDLPEPTYDGTSGRARTGRILAVGVALAEAFAAAAGAAVAVLTGLRGGSLPLGLGVGAAAAATAYLLVEVARGFLAGRRWPVGIFVTVQLLVALVALSVGSGALLAIVAAPAIGVPTLLALVAAGLGLAGVALLVSGGRADAGS